MRLLLVISRWESGTLGMLYMMGKWSDAHALFVSFIDAELSKERGQQHAKELREAFWKSTHYFSLLHGLALINLKECEGQAFGRLSGTGSKAISELHTLPVMHPHDPKSRHETCIKHEDCIRERMRSGLGDKTDWINKIIIIGKIEDQERNVGHSKLGQENTEQQKNKVTGIVC